jgi:hypothetical protein
MNKGPVRRKVPKGRPGGTVSAVRHAAKNPKPKSRKHYKAHTSATPKVPKVAPAPDYTHAKGGTKGGKKGGKGVKKKKTTPLKRLVKFVRGDYTKKKP